MLTWLKNHLFNRWSFNLLIWHGLRMILRLAVILDLIRINLPEFGFFSEGFSPIYLFVDSTAQVLIIFTPIIVFFLEKIYGFRFTPRFFQNKFAFILYILIAIPALIAEAIFLCVLIAFSVVNFGDFIEMSLNSYDLLEYFFSTLLSPSYWGMLLIWVL